MAAANLSSDMWMIMLVIAGFAVVMCLAVLGTVAKYEADVRQLRRKVREQDPFGMQRSRRMEQEKQKESRKAA